MNDNFNIKNQMFNSSCISDYMGCPRLFYYTWIRGLVTKTEKPALVFGRVFHEALKEHYKTGDVEEAIKKFDQIPSTITDDHRTREWGTAIFKQYVERYKTEQGKTLHLEVKFRVEIGDRLYAGTMDRIEDWNKLIYVDDHKTTKSLGLSFFEGFRPHPQIDGYCFACKEIMGKCHGAIINGISVAKNPKDRFQRFTSSRTEQEIEGWKEVFMDTTDDILRDFQRNHFPKRTNYCTRWGKCRFWELCVYGEDERFIEQSFKVEKRGGEDGAISGNDAVAGNVGK